MYSASRVECSTGVLGSLLVTTTHYTLNTEFDLRCAQPRVHLSMDATDTDVVVSAFVDA